MIFLPDTNVWIRFLNPGENLVKARFLSSDPSTIWLCAVVKAELSSKSNTIPYSFTLSNPLVHPFFRNIQESRQTPHDAIY